MSLFPSRSPDLLVIPTFAPSARGRDATRRGRRQKLTAVPQPWPVAVLKVPASAPPIRTMRAITSITALCLAALALIPASASASSKQLALFQDDRQLLLRGDAVRDSTLDELRALGVDAIKV